MHQGDEPDSARPLGDDVPAPTAYARTYRVREITVVELSGEIDLGSAEHVHPHLDALALSPRSSRSARSSSLGPQQAPPPLVVVLDLGPLEFIDCYGLSLLVRTRRRIVERGGRVRMACAHPPTRKLLALTGLDGLFHPARTLEEALRA